MSPLERFPLLKLSHVPSNLVFKLMDAKYCIILLSSGKRLSNLTREMMGRPTRFALTIHHIRRTYYHVKIDFPNTPTVHWNIDSQRDRVVGPIINHTISGCKLETFDGVDFNGHSCFDTYFPEATTKIPQVINCLVAALETNLTNITFTTRIFRALQSISNWDQLLLADHVHFEGDERYFESDVINQRKAAGKRTTFEHVVWTGFGGITASVINSTSTKYLVMIHNTLSVDEAYTMIQERLGDNTDSHHLLRFPTNHWRNGELQDLQSRLATSPVTRDFIQSYEPEVPNCYSVNMKPETNGRCMVGADGDQWVFYFTENEVEMVRWRRPRRFDIAEFQ